MRPGGAGDARNRWRGQGRSGQRRPCVLRPRDQHRAARHVPVARRPRSTPACRRRWRRPTSTGCAAAACRRSSRRRSRSCWATTDVAVGGGAESMSRAPYILPAQRWGARMGDAKALDMMVGALSDPFDAVHMGDHGRERRRAPPDQRKDQDELALVSHQRAARGGGRRALQVADRAGRDRWSSASR